MLNQFSRTQLLYGKAAMERLANARVAVFGVGGVGGYVCEALVRSGVGAFDLVDKDTVSITNLNRQIIATEKTIGRYKTEVMKERMSDINPEVRVNIHSCFFLPENADSFSFEEYDYVVDAVDTVTAKIEIIKRAKEKNVPVISSMGAGNKLDPGRFRIADIYETEVCPLARVMRRELKKRGIRDVKVVYSDEPPIQPEKICGETEGMIESGNGVSGSEPEKKKREKSVPGSTAFVPSVAGLLIAAEVVKDLTEGFTCFQ